MNIATLSTAIGVAATLGTGGYWLKGELGERPTRTEFLVVAVKSETVLQESITYWIAEAARLEAKCQRGCSGFDREQLRFAREKVKNLQDIQKLK